MALSLISIIQCDSPEHREVLTIYIYISVSFFSNSFPPHPPTILPDIDPIVGVDLNVAAVGGQEEVEDVVAVELGNMTP